MTKRKDVLFPRVTRKVLDGTDLFTMDVENGSRIKRMVYCEYHRKMEWIADFYMESAPKAKHSDDVRSMCIAGWDATEGKLSNDPVIKRNKETSTGTLLEFLKD
jgi:hypothetical protein